MPTLWISKRLLLTASTSRCWCWAFLVLIFKPPSRFQIIFGWGTREYILGLQSSNILLTYLSFRLSERVFFCTQGKGGKSGNMCWTWGTPLAAHSSCAVSECSRAVMSPEKRSLGNYKIPAYMKLTLTLTRWTFRPHWLFRPNSPLVLVLSMSGGTITARWAIWAVIGSVLTWHM